VERTVDHFLITGAGRCGTHWWQAALDEHLGVRTGHEAVYSPWGRVRDPGSPRRRPWGRFAGDCSWPAVAYLDAAVDPSTRVVHTVRDPLAMVRSRLGDNKLSDERRPRGVREFVFRHRPDIRTDDVDGADTVDGADDLGRAIRFVARWNRWCETELRRLGFEHRRVRVEDASCDGEVLGEAVAFLTGRRPTPAATARAIAMLDDDIGRHPRAPVRWSDIAAHPDGHELVALARDYGYPTS
jgi:hypothetical protein